MADDGVEVVELRFPAQRLSDAVGGSDRHRPVAGAAAGELNREVMTGGAADRVEHLAHRIAAAVAAIERRAGAALAKIFERREMRTGEIGDMDVIADAGAVW